MLKCSQGAQIQSRSSASSWGQAGSLYPLRWLVAMTRLSKVILVGLVSCSVYSGVGGSSPEESSSLTSLPKTNSLTWMLRPSARSEQNSPFLSRATCLRGSWI